MPKRKEDPIRETQTFYYPNAIVRVHFPDISAEEHERRMKRIRDAAAELLKETMKNEARKQQEKATQN